ncbi:hypothetical protein BO70DRAFT_381944 [Aspergillus heteromorphus CBS 117.55]|uniref:Uncharacterized protein n=1 Tax=Aspergillus heteromorphus CBS 117.55 TaxID=1448321 RepID=A0A317VBK7_9EURO|nr:uncharacterized protein BO70DRAFT_381944 [Aspergillus heteromorphus CBS 117.55]PWY71606.1 hypothetical protein BO70DRAFT_381944 [Aspergillus heteromorphus CBS 117.55]
MKFNLLYIVALFVTFVASAAVSGLGDDEFLLSNKDMSGFDDFTLADLPVATGDEGTSASDIEDTSASELEDTSAYDLEGTSAYDLEENDLFARQARCHRRCGQDSDCCPRWVCVLHVCMGPNH